MSRALQQARGGRNGRDLWLGPGKEGEAKPCSLWQQSFQTGYQVSSSKQVLALGTRNRPCRLGRGPPSSRLPRPHCAVKHWCQYTGLSQSSCPLSSFIPFLLAEGRRLCAKLYDFLFKKNWSHTIYSHVLLLPQLLRSSPPPYPQFNVHSFSLKIKLKNDKQ